MGALKISWLYWLVVLTLTGVLIFFVIKTFQLKKCISYIFYYVFSFKTKEISRTFKHLKFYESFRPFQIELEIWKWLVFGWEGGCAKYLKKWLLGVYIVPCKCFLLWFMAKQMIIKTEWKWMFTPLSNFSAALE